MGKYSASQDDVTVNDESMNFFTSSAHRFYEHYLHIPGTPEGSSERIEQELPNIQRAIQLAINHNSHGLLPQFWDSIKDYLMDTGYWQVFVYWGSTILSAIDNLNEPETKAWLHSDLGWIAMEQHHYSKAAEYFREARDIFGEVSDQAGLCSIERYLGVLFYRMDNFDDASAQFEKSLTIANKENFKGAIAEVKNLQGSLARKFGNFEQADRYYLEALEKYKQLGDRWRLTAVLRNLSRMQIQLGELEHARVTVTEAIDLCNSLGRKDMLFGCHLILAELEVEAGRTLEARKLALSALSGFTQLGMSPGIEKAEEFLRSLPSFEQ